MIFICTYVIYIIWILIKAGLTEALCSSLSYIWRTQSPARVSREIPAWEGWIEKHLIKLTMWHFWRRKEHLRCVNRHLECKCCEPLQPSPDQPCIAPTAAKSSQIPSLIGPIKKRNNYLYIELCSVFSLWTQGTVKSILCSMAMSPCLWCFFSLFNIYVLLIKCTATVTVWCHSPVHICWHMNP